MAAIPVSLSAATLYTFGPGIVANGNSGQINTISYQRVGLLIGLPAAPSTSLTVTVSGVDAAGNLYPLIVSAALAAATSVQLQAGPGLATVANVSAGLLVPQLVQVSWVIVGTAAGATLQLYGR
jgi:hypothetical protein